MAKPFTVGTRSVLYGAHAFWLHWAFVAWAWTKLYGFPWDPRLWAAFVVHDWGYWGKIRMDDAEGEKHCELGAKIMTWLFDPKQPTKDWESIGLVEYGKPAIWFGKWGQFSLFHSRFYAKKHKQPHSRLCVADKLAICITPRWLYLPMVNLTGEIHEYLAMSQKNGNTNEVVTNQKAWHDSMCKYVRAWVEEFKDGKVDTWTPEAR